MAQIHLKIYDYTESEDQVNRKKEFKQFIKTYKDLMIEKEQKMKQERERDPTNFKEEEDPKKGIP
jgi:hypothetical protein